jgi:hypothetical protein
MLGTNHPVISHGVVITHARNFSIPAREVKTASRVVFRPRRRLDDKHSSATIAQASLHFGEQARAVPVPLHRWVDSDPVEIEGAIGSRRCPKACVRDEDVVVETTEELVVASDRLIEELECDLHFVWPEDGGRVEDLPQTSAVCSLQRAEPHRGHLSQ